MRPGDLLMAAASLMALWPGLSGTADSGSSSSRGVGHRSTSLPRRPSGEPWIELLFVAAWTCGDMCGEGSSEPHGTGEALTAEAIAEEADEAETEAEAETAVEETAVEETAVEEAAAAAAKTDGTWGWKLVRTSDGLTRRGGGDGSRVVAIVVGLGGEEVAADGDEVDAGRRPGVAAEAMGSYVRLWETRGRGPRRVISRGGS